MDNKEQISPSHEWFVKLSNEDRARIEDKYLGISTFDLKEGQTLVQYIYEKEVLNANKENN